MEFRVEQKVIDLGVRVLGVEIDDIDNQRESDAYHAWRRDTVQKLLTRYADYDVKSDPILNGYYDLHRKVNVPRRKNPSAPENLIRLLEKKQGLVVINKAVDIYNIISLESELALGAHDLSHVAGNVTLKLTDGSENFVPLGAEAPVPVKAGEYAYTDDQNDILCRLEIRQVEKDKVTEDTGSVFYIVQGNENTDDALLAETARQLIAKTTEFCGGSGRILKTEVI